MTDDTHTHTDTDTDTATPVAIVPARGGIPREEAIALVDGIRARAGLAPLSEERIAAADARQRRQGVEP